MAFTQMPGQSPAQRAMQEQQAIRQQQMQQAWWQQQQQQAGTAPVPITDTLGWFGRLVRGLLTLVLTLAFLGAAAFGVFALVEGETEIAIGAGVGAVVVLLLRHWIRSWGRI